MPPLWKQILNINPLVSAGSAVAPLWKRILQPRQPMQQPIQSKTTDTLLPSFNVAPLWQRILNQDIYKQGSPPAQARQSARALGEQVRQKVGQPFARGAMKTFERAGNLANKAMSPGTTYLTPQLQKYGVNPTVAFGVGLGVDILAPGPGELKGASKLSKTDDLKPLIQEARKIGNYTMSHRPTKGSPAYDIAEGGYIPQDVYTNPEYYANMKDKNYQESFEILRKIKNNPEMEVTIYRASPKNELNSGDWVSFSKGYAKQESLIEKTPVYAFKVKAKDVYFAGDDLNEFGYFPTSKKLNINDEAMQTLRVIENNFSKGGMSKYVYNLSMKNEINRLLKLGYTKEQLPDIFYNKQ